MLTQNISLTVIIALIVSITSSNHCYTDSKKNPQSPIAMHNRFRNINL